MGFITKYRFGFVTLTLLIALFCSLSSYFKHSVNKRGFFGDQFGYYTMAKSFLDSDLQLGFMGASQREMTLDERKRHNFHYVILSGPGYSAFLALLELVFKADSVQDLLKFQGSLNILSIILIYLIIKRGSKSDKAAAIGALLYVLYLPFVYMQAYFHTENLCHALVLAVVFFAQRLDGVLDKKIWPFIVILLLAISLAWLYLTRGVYFYFSIAFVAIILVKLLTDGRLSLGRKAALASFVVVANLLPYSTWVHKVTNHYDDGQIHYSVNGKRSIKHSAQESYNVERDGYPQTNIGSSSGRILSPDPKTSIAEAPVRSFILRIDKVYRLWHSSLTVYNDPLLGSHKPINALHVLLLLSALFFFAYIKDIFLQSILALPILYSTASYGAYFSEEQRFIFPVMSLVIIISVLGGANFLKILAADKQLATQAISQPAIRLSVIKKHAPYGVAMFGLCLALLISPVRLGVELSLLQYGFYVLTLTGLIFILCAMWQRKGPVDWKSFYRLGALSFVLVAVSVHQVFFSRWYISPQIVTAQTQIYSKRFEVNKPLKKTKIRQAYISIDAKSRDKNFDPTALKLTFNGEPIEAPIPISKLGRHYGHAIQHMSPISPVDEVSALSPDFKSWLVYPVPNDFISAGENEVQIDFAHLGDQDLLIYRSVLSSDTAYCGPRTPLPHKVSGKQAHRDIGRISLWKYQSDGDIRLYGCQDKAAKSKETYPLNVVFHMFDKGAREVLY